MKALGHLDTNENFWTIGCILGILGIPGMIIGGQLARSYGTSSAIISICIGNLILWILGLGIISMTEGKGHAIDNIKKHFGKWSGFLAAILFLADFLIWYTLQLSITTSTLSNLFHIDEEWKIGVTLGCAAALLSIGGFKMLKWACLIAFPIITALIIYSIAIQTEATPTGKFQFSYFAIFLVMMSYLSGMVNLPTFFRHSRSKTDSILALSLIMIIHISFQTLMIFSKIDTSLINMMNGIQETNSLLYLSIITIFSLVLFFSINLTNIYFVSACWEMLFPKDYRSRKYILFGIIGTVAYIYLRSSSSSKVLLMPENIMNYSMAILLLALLINFLISLAVKHRLRYLDKFLGSISWLIGCATTLYFLVKTPDNPNKALLFGAIATLLFSMSTVFIEETVWSIKKIKQES